MKRNSLKIHILCEIRFPSYRNIGIILITNLLTNVSDSFAVHNEYLNKVHEHCLLTEEFEDLMTTINNVCTLIGQ